MRFVWRLMSIDIFSFRASPKISYLVVVGGGQFRLIKCIDLKCLLLVCTTLTQSHYATRDILAQYGVKALHVVTLRYEIAP